METDTYLQAGIQVERPDYWVVRVSLLGLSSLDELQSALYKAGPRVRNAASATMTKARQRFNASGPGSQQKKYINILAGRQKAPDMASALAVVRGAGLDARLAPGPLILATTGGAGAKPTCMPFGTSSAHGPTKELLVEAHRVANLDPLDPDPELDVERGRSAKWTSHSMRRAANTTARRDREQTSTTEAEIDIYLGWHERILLKDMQRHYEAMSIRERMKQARITGLL